MCFDVSGVRWSAGGQEYLWSGKERKSALVRRRQGRSDHRDDVVLRHDGQSLVCGSAASSDRKDEAGGFPSFFRYSSK